MTPAKIIARFRDGHMKKGYSQDFFPNRAVFHIFEDPTKASRELEEVYMDQLKAVFFVKDFSGNPSYKEKREFEEGEKTSGRKVEILFEDGELRQGTVLGYNPQQSGFFLFPVDPNSNNERMFVVSAAVKGFRYL